jgi:large subunit ribosomal protein L31
MKKGIHPKEHRLVAFKDMSNDHTFVTKSGAQTRDTIEIDGVKYPLVKIEISNTSHPFYTGKMKLVDTAGRIDKFRNKYKKHLDDKNEIKGEEIGENEKAAEVKDEIENKEEEKTEN